MLKYIRFSPKPLVIGDFMNKTIKKLSLPIVLLLLAACASATPPGEVMITGDLSLTYIPGGIWAAEWQGDQHVISLDLQSDVASEFPGVSIWVPAEIQPGNYSIENVGSSDGDGIVAAFTYYVDGQDHTYWSTDGSIELTATGDVYSGSFTFDASLEFTQGISVTGFFEEAVLDPELSFAETPTNEPTAEPTTVEELPVRETATRVATLAAEETATETATKTPVPLGTGEVVVRGNHKLKYTLGYTSVDSSGYFTYIELLMDPPQQGSATGVILELPSGLMPSTYDIGNRITNEGYLFALFHFVKEDGTMLNYASTEGELVLKETGSVFSGSFEFKAILYMGEGMEDETNHVTVTGRFKGVVVVIEERG